MTITIEGVDLSGKDTLCNKFVEKYGLDLVHITSHDPNDFDFYKQCMRKSNVVYSRLHIGEMIYPNIYNRVGNLDLKKLVELQEFSNNNGVKTLVLTADNEELYRRLKVRGNEIQSVIDNLPKINEKFVEYANLLGVPVIDTSKISFEDICKRYIEV